MSRSVLFDCRSRQTLARPVLQGGRSTRAHHAAAFRRGGVRSHMHPHPRCSLGTPCPRLRSLSRPSGLNAA